MSQVSEPKYWWHVACAARLPPRLKWLGHDCPACGEHRAAASASYRHQSYNWYHGTYEEFRYELSARNTKDIEDSQDDYIPEMSGSVEQASDYRTDLVFKEEDTVIDCAICLETANKNVPLECGHSFCSPCFREWRRCNPTCPMCRADLRPKIQAPVVEVTLCAFCPKALSPSRLGKGKSVCNDCSNCQGCNQHVRDLAGKNLCLMCAHARISLVEPVKPEIPTTDISDDWIAVVVTRPLPSCVNGGTEFSKDVAAIARPIEKLVVPTLVTAVQDVAANARPRYNRRGVRSGRVKQTRKLGTCYAGLVTRKEREGLVQKLGKAPLVANVVDAIEGLPMTTLPKALVARPGCYHVTPRPGWNMKAQLKYLDGEIPTARIAGDQWEDPEIEEDAEWYWLHVFKKQLDGNAFIKQASLDDLEVPIPVEEPVVEEPEQRIVMVEEPKKVGGAGDCWKKLPGMPSMWYNKKGVIEHHGSRWEMTLKELLSIRSKSFVSMTMPRTMNALFVKWNYQEDGDIHVEDVVSSRRPGYDPEHVFWTKMKAESQVKLVGKPDTAPADSAMRALNNPTVQMNLQNAVSAKVTDALGRVNKICPWAIPAANQHHASELKIPWSETNADTHDHPIHAAIRRIQCYEELPKHVKSDYTTVSMGQANWGMLETGLRSLGREYKATHVNPIIDMKDHSRFAGTSSVPESVFRLPEIITPTVIFHDSGHYLTESFLWKFFLKNPKVMFVYLTHVYPLVSLIADASPDPTLYQFHYADDGTLVYIPEGHLGGKYEQPADPGLLLANTISDKHGLLAIHGSIIDSRLNSHVQCWSRFQLSTNSYVALSMPDMMPLRRLKRAMPKKLPLIKTEYYTKLYQYAKTIPIKEADAWGKLRQFTVDNHMYFPIGVQAMLIDSVLEAVKIPVVADLQSKYYGTTAEMIRYKTLGHLIRLKHKFFEAKFAKRAQELVNEPHPLHLVPTIQILIKELGWSEYGVEWQVPESERKNFFMLLKGWVGRWRKDVNVTEKNMFNLSGTVVWDETTTLTSRTKRSMGIEIIMAAQARTYQAVFEGNLPKPVEESKTLSRPLEPHKILAPPPEPDGSDSESSTGRTDAYFDKYEAESETSEEEEDWTQGWFSPTQHCLDCVTLEEFLSRWPKLTRKDYAEYTCGWHLIWRSRSGKDNVQRRLQLGDMLVRSMRKRQIEEKQKFPTNPDPNPNEDDALRELPLIPHVAPESVERVRGYIQEALKDPGQLRPPSVQRSFTPRPFPWAGAEEQWNKIQMARKRIPYEPVGTGVALWDNLFPKTVDKRHQQTPFTNPLFYPPITYPQGDCLLVALNQLMQINPCTLLLNASRAISKKDTEGDDLSTDVLETLGCHYLCTFEVFDNKDNILSRHGVLSPTTFRVRWHENHFTPIGVVSREMMIKPPLVPRNAPKGLQELINELSALPSMSWSEWTPSPTRAAQLIRAMIERTTGTLAGNELNMEQLKGWENMCEGLKKDVRERFISVVVGSPGCRKSSGIQKVLRKKKYQRDNLFAVSMATNTLAIDWRDKLGVRDKDPVTNRPTPGRYVSTFERCVADGNWGWVMVLDEDKYPKGYIDLLAALFPWVGHFIFMCDPYQTEWHEPNSACHLNDPATLGNAAFLFPHATRYLFGTWRLPQNIANFFQLPTWNRGEGSFHFAVSPPKTWTDLAQYFGHRYDEGGLQELWKRRMMMVSSHAAKSWVDALAEADSATFSGSQGLSVELAIVEIDVRVLRLTDPKMIFTVLTRAKEVLLVCSYSLDGTTQLLIEANPVFRQLLKYRQTYHPGQIVKIHPDWTVDIFKLVNPLPTSMQLVLAGPPQSMVNHDFITQLIGKPWVGHINPDDRENIVPTVSEPVWPVNAVKICIVCDKREGRHDHFEFAKGYGNSRQVVSDDAGPYCSEVCYEHHVSLQPKRGGARLDPFSEVYKDASDFKPYILTYKHEFVKETSVAERVIPGGKLTTHLPVVNENELIEANDSDVLERYERELSYKRIFSRQAPDTPIAYWNSGDRRKRWMKAYREGLPSKLSRRDKDDAVRKALKQGMDFDFTHYNPHHSSWGLDQRSDDGPSFAAGVAQRIRRKTYVENKREVEDGVGYGHALWDALCHYLGWKQTVPWDKELYADCEILFQMRRADRSDALKKMSLNRASPDYVDFLTAKTQWKLKGRESKKASPLQTILVRSDRVLFRDGPLGIYLLEMIERHAPRYVYLHARKTFEQMGDWIASQPESNEYEMCDIEGFDSSIRGADVTLEQDLMRFFHVPEDHISEYVEDKMDFHTRTIHFGIMRFSGEIFTWLFNTMHTLARECLKYDHQPGDPIAVSGDDVLKWRRRNISSGWWRWQHSDPSVEKRYADKRGEFCSFIVYKRTIFKDPVILYRRLKGQIERGRVDEVALGYFEMFAVQYRLADRLYDLMDEKELEYCAAINRLMFNWKKVTGSTINLPWSKVHVDFVDESGGSRAEAINALEKFFGMDDPRELEPITNADIVSTHQPGVSFSYIYGEIASIDY